MQNVKAGDSVQFKYHNKMRAGRVERTWPSTLDTTAGISLEDFVWITTEVTSHTATTKSSI